MNQAQRNYLIKKIEDNAKAQISAYESSLPKYPDISNFLFHAVMSGEFDIIPIEQIKAIILEKALKAESGKSWLNEDSSWGSLSDRAKISFRIRDFFVMSEEYEKRLKEYRDKEKEINEKIASIRLQVDTLVTRIQLASDRVLDKMINEIDDMGDISLIDTKIKFLNSGS